MFSLLFMLNLFEGNLYIFRFFGWGRGAIIFRFLWGPPQNLSLVIKHWKSSLKWNQNTLPPLYLGSESSAYSPKKGKKWIYLKHSQEVHYSIESCLIMAKNEISVTQNYPMICIFIKIMGNDLSCEVCDLWPPCKLRLEICRGV